MNVCVFVFKRVSVLIIFVTNKLHNAAVRNEWRIVNINILVFD